MRDAILTSLILALAAVFSAGGCKSGESADKNKQPQRPPLYGKKVVFVVAKEGFNDHELVKPRAAVEKQGAKVTIACSEKGECQGMYEEIVRADLALTDVKMDQFDAVVFVGGMGADTYFKDAEAHRIAKEAAAGKKLVAAICIAPTILAKAGLLTGRKVTAYSSEKSGIEEAGGTYVNKQVVVDTAGEFPLLTGAGPDAAAEFGQALAKGLARAKKAPAKKDPPKKDPAKKDPAKKDPAKGDAGKSTEGSGSK
jgi:protease I